jgi:hypothetical protein
MRSPVISLPLLLALWALSSGCSQAPVTKVAPLDSKLRLATDVFWAMDKLGYMISKEKPNPSTHGCKPFEYLAQKGQAQFRVSVFECGDPDQARALIEHPYNQKVDSLLRNHGEGGMLQRGPLQIIIRRTQGERMDAETLMESLGGL